MAYEYDATEIKDELIAKEVRKFGKTYTIYDLHRAGYTKEQMVDFGFNIIDIMDVFKAVKDGYHDEYMKILKGQGGK